MERLHKYMARCGVASRRLCEDIITQGRVKVNGNIIKEVGVKVDPYKDEVVVNGKVIKDDPCKVYILVNKPRGYLSTVRDDRGRATVLDLVTTSKRLYPVGRLDMDAKGLIILTNDGQFANMLMHPRYHVPKTYHVLIKGIPNNHRLKEFEEGLILEDGPTASCKISIKEVIGDDARVEIVLYEGRKRQIKRMCKKIGHPVKDLKRIAIGSVRDEKLPEGKYRSLRINEIDMLKRQGQEGKDS